MKKRRLLFSFCSIFLVLGFLLIPPACCEVGTTTGGRAVYGVLELMSSPNPFNTAGAVDSIVMSRVYEPLVIVHDDGSILPGLAESWTYDEAEATYTFTLRDAEWSDGQPVTAADVKYSLDKCWELDTASGADAKPLVAEDPVTVIDDSTVEIELAETIGTFLSNMNGPYIVPKHIWEDIDDTLEYANANPVGSGPFLWEEYVENQYVLMSANPNYWGGAPHIDELLFKLYGSAEAMILALKANEVDMCSVEQYSQVPQLLLNPDIKIVLDAPSNYWSFIYPNHRVEPNHIPAFRKAVDLAIDKQQIIDFSVAGYGSIPSQTPMVPEALLNPDTDWPGLDYETDAERIAAANDMLDSIPLMSDMPADPPDGWVRTYDGEDLVFQLDHQSTPERVRTAEIIKNSLAEVGITMNLNVMGTGAMVAMLFFGEDFENWEWALFGHGASPGWDGLVQEYANPNYNVWYDAPAVGWGDDGEGGGTTTALAAQDAIRAVQLETDPEDQLALAYTAQELYAAEMPVLLGHQANLIFAYNKANFTNWAPVGHFDGYGSSGMLASNPNLISIMPVAEE